MVCGPFRCHPIGHDDDDDDDDDIDNSNNNEKFKDTNSLKSDDLFVIAPTFWPSDEVSQLCSLKFQKFKTDDLFGCRCFSLKMVQMLRVHR